MALGTGPVSRLCECDGRRHQQHQGQSMPCTSPSLFHSALDRPSAGWWPGATWTRLGPWLWRSASQQACAEVVTSGWLHQPPVTCLAGLPAPQTLSHRRLDPAIPGILEMQPSRDAGSLCPGLAVLSEHSSSKHQPNCIPSFGPQQ